VGFAVVANEECGRLGCHAVWLLEEPTFQRKIVTASVVSNTTILVTLMMVALYSSEVSGLTRSTRRNISEDGILHETRYL
jgi:hypothetical protein